MLRHGQRLRRAERCGSGGDIETSLPMQGYLAATLTSVLLLAVCVIMITGTEALAGLSLITWSASFTFLQMQRIWRS